MATALAPPIPTTAPILPIKRTPRLAGRGKTVVAMRSAGQRLVSVCSPAVAPAKV